MAPKGKMFVIKRGEFDFFSHCKNNLLKRGVSESFARAGYN